MRRFAAIAVFLALAVSAVRAAPDEFDPRDQRRLFAVRDTNAARHAIDDARTSLRRGQVLRGLTAAQRVLDEMTDDFFLQEAESSPASVLWSSAAEVVRELLAGLSPELREAYEQMVAPSAGPLLEEALQRRDEQGLRDVLRRYGASRPGIKAASILATITGEAGRWRDAGRYLREGLRYAPQEASLWIRLFDALAESGDRATLAGLEPPPGLEGEHAGERKLLTAWRDAALAKIPAPQGFEGWPMWGGTPARNAQLPHETPMPHRRRWSEATDWMKRRSDQARAYFGRSTGSHVFREMLGTFRPVHPVLDGRTVYVSDGRTVRGYDVYSGRRVWSFDAETNDTPLNLMPTGVVGYGRTSLDRAFSPVVAGDLVLATIEVVGAYDPEYLQGVEISTYKPRRVLVALDKHTGAVRWRMGERGLDQLTLAETTIVAPPAAAEGLVLAVGAYHDGNHNVSFLAFDLQTGALRWRRPLGFGQQELNLFGASLKELAASPIAIAEGVAYASTGLGFVAAVDIRSGVPRWLASYEIIPVRKVQLWYDAPVRTPKIATSPPVVMGDTLIVCPTDGLHVHAFDRRTGKLLWRKPYETANIAYDVTGHFLGVANDGRRDVVLLTDNELRARDLETGETVWRGRFDPEDDRVIGRGAVAGGDILVPTREGLQRFGLGSDGAYRGTVPWPQDSDPGNLLPLGRVLIVTGLRELQWFYDWAAIERDVQKRRLERPDDPTILLEAGEMYLRGGGETKRARKAFEQAREVARRAQPELEGRALEGLYDTWLLEGDQNATFPDEATKAYRMALSFASTAEQRVRARMRLDRLLREHDEPARIKNLEALVEDAADALAVIDPADGRVPARAAALLLLAEAHVDGRRPGKAIDVFQRILKEEREAPLPEGIAGDIAQAAIGLILEATGRLPYQAHERKAQALLERAIKEKDEALLDQLLLEYPNASVVTDALLERARSHLGEGRPLPAAEALQQLLRAAPADHPLRATALAGLARAYREAGAFGAARAALGRLAARHGETPLTWEKQSWTGAAFAAAERKVLEGTQPTTTLPDVTLQAPLAESHFEAVGDEEYARPIDVVTDRGGPGPAIDAPLALMMRGRELVAIDLIAGEVSWTSDVRSCQRAAWADGVLIVAASRELRGLDARTGKLLWKRETGAIARDLQISGGLAYALVQDVVAGSRGNRLIAVDVYRGVDVWSVTLPRSDYRNLQPWGDRLLLRQVRYDRSGARGELLVFDAFDGRRRHTLPVPLQVDTPPVVAGNLWCVAGTSDGRSKRVLTAFDLDAGEVRWKRELEGRFMVGALVRDGPNLLLLQQDGTLATHALKDGALLHQTRVYVGEGGNARPFPSSPMLARGQRVTFIPWVRKPSLSVVCYDRKTGKLQWEAPYAPGLVLSKAALVDGGDLLVAMIAYRKDGTQRILLRLLDRKSGEIVQTIEPDALSKDNWVPSLHAGYGTVVLYGKTGASILRGAAKAESQPKKAVR